MRTSIPIQNVWENETGIPTQKVWEMRTGIPIQKVWESEKKMGKNNQQH